VEDAVPPYLNTKPSKCASTALSRSVFNAPTAKEIVLVANFLPEPMPLKKDENGMFSGTTPLEPPIYHCHYNIDGVRGIDPHNFYSQRGADDATGSIFEVHAAPAQYFNPNPCPMAMWARSGTNRRASEPREFSAFTRLPAMKRVRRNTRFSISFTATRRMKRLARNRPRQLHPR
jgi:hypothetical protein